MSMISILTCSLGLIRRQEAFIAKPYWSWCPACKVVDKLSKLGEIFFNRKSPSTASNRTPILIFYPAWYKWGNSNFLEPIILIVWKAKASVTTAPLDHLISVKMVKTEACAYLWLLHALIFGRRSNLYDGYHGGKLTACSNSFFLMSSINMFTVVEQMWTFLVCLWYAARGKAANGLCLLCRHISLQMEVLVSSYVKNTVSGARCFLIYLYQA